MSIDRIRTATDLMLRFAERTGLAPDGAQRRYLWTDAFAVCNFLGLAATSGGERFAQLALLLIDRVHHVLGRHRADDARHGWISGLAEEDGEAHPTGGGLRIGKPLPERAPGAPLDERSEWDRDGQYFHYLTKWMHALDQAARATGDATLARFGRELAVAAHRGFTYVPRGGTRKRLFWKASIDLSRPLVPTMGQHDPLDGFVTCVQLAATAGSEPDPDLARATGDFAAMVDPRNLASSDPLGIGGLLSDAYRVHQLVHQGALPPADGLLDTLLAGALAGLSAYLDQPDLGLPAPRRLAFRELGLAIGLAAVERLVAEPYDGPAAQRRTRDALGHLCFVRNEIESFWLADASRQNATWLDHADINEVMLATSLAPDGFLVLREPPPRASEDEDTELR